MEGYTMSRRDRRDDLSRHWQLASAVSGVVGMLYAALSPFGRDAWTSADLLITLVGMIVLLIPGGAAIGLIWGLMLWTLLSPLAARRRKASGCDDPEGGPAGRTWWRRLWGAVVG
jgi:hypothetical protein